MSCCQYTWCFEIVFLLYSASENGVEKIDGINQSFVKNILIPFDTFEVKPSHEDFWIHIISIYWLYANFKGTF